MGKTRLTETITWALGMSIKRFCAVYLGFILIDGITFLG